MKKVVSLIVVIVMLGGVLVSASASGFGFDFGNIFGSTFGMLSNSIPHNITMPDQFSITYELVDDGKFIEIIMEKDKDGNYHYKDAENEYLFIRDGKGYKIAIKTLIGFAYKSNDKYTFERVKELTEKFWNCATPSEDDFAMGTITQDGTGNVCNRITDIYKIELGFGYNFGGFNVSMEDVTYYEFDQETGICLASSTNEDVNFLGMSVDDDEQSGFECINFELQNILLPTVK